MQLTQTDKDVLKLLKEGRSAGEIAETLKIGDGVHSVVHKLVDEGLAEVEEQVESVVSLGVEGIKHAKNGLPERRALDAIQKGPMTISEMAKKAKLDSDEVKIALAWLRKKEWAQIIGGKLRITEQGRKAFKKEGPDEALLKLLSKGEKCQEELKDQLEGLEVLIDRKNNLIVKENKKPIIELTQKGEEIFAEKPAEKVKAKASTGEKGAPGPIAPAGGELSSVTHEMLKSGSWKGKGFRAYGVREAIETYPAKLHPIRVAMEKIKRIFLEMGFTEATGNFIESSFWNFDALFQPQDHPARELADTFYLEQLEHELPEHHKPVKEMHETGGDIESKGWQYEWDLAKARQCVLRTHTTAVSARSLTKIEVPARLFSIGRVFRNEAIDYKHLAEFYQVEGIVVGEDVNFTNLLWYLKEFYNKLGFEKVRFRPAYFPYTEMSCEPEVYFEGKKEWVELGGSGIFRPEVVKPLLGIEVPVLAWGLSLERPLMMKMGLDDIRTFYRNDLDWLRQYEMDVL